MKPASIFLTQVTSPSDLPAVQLLIDSIRSFGGELSGCPVWVFASDPLAEACRGLFGPQAEVLPSSAPETVRGYPFAEKVYACAQAECLAPTGVDTLIWIDPECLVLQSPRLYLLGQDFDLALRPVHLRNVGLTPDEALDPFWEAIYAAVGVRDTKRTVESFVDRQILRAYYNSHAFSVRPALGLLRRWYVLFEGLVCDRRFQERACREPRQRIFLFQALLSALVAASVAEHRVRILPQTYNYPYNLHGRLDPERRAVALDDLVSLTYEGRSLHPDSLMDIEIREPLRSWLQSSRQRRSIGGVSCMKR